MSTTIPTLSALNTNDLLFEEKPLHQPPLPELQKVLQLTLAKNFADVSVTIEECPDLTGEQYGLMDSGLSGSPTLLELGGAPYLLPTVQKEKLYDIKEICRKCMGSGKIFAVGAGAGPYPLRALNCEGIFNMSISADNKVKNGSYTAKVYGLQEDCLLESVPDNETRCALLLNLFVSRGHRGPVVKISCKKRTGHLNFIECIRKGLLEQYQEKCVGMGGLFLLKRGKAYQHVMRDFSQSPIHTETELNKWLKFFEMPATLHAVGTLITHEHLEYIYACNLQKTVFNVKLHFQADTYNIKDYVLATPTVSKNMWRDLDLRLHHFHSFSKTNWGGHYHYDTTPDTVEYEAYFNVAERIVRVDKPVTTHKFGRD